MKKYQQITPKIKETVEKNSKHKWRVGFLGLPSNLGRASSKLHVRLTRVIIFIYMYCDLIKIKKTRESECIIILWRSSILLWFYDISLLAFSFSNGNTKARCKIFSKLTRKNSQWSQWRCFGVFIVNFEQRSHLILVLLLLSLNK